MKIRFLKSVIATARAHKAPLVISRGSTRGISASRSQDLAPQRKSA